MIEKILRVQPNVKKLYILLRTTDELTATKRFYDEVHDCPTKTLKCLNCKDQLISVKNLLRIRIKKKKK